MGRGNVMEVKFYDTVNDELLKFAVVISKSKNRLLSFTVCEQFVRQYVEENPEDLVYVLE